MLNDAPPAPVFPVRWAHDPFGGRYHDTACVLFHQMIETGGSTLARVLLERSRREGTQYFNAELLLGDRSILPAAGDSVDFIYGHNAYGFHTEAPRPARYFTMLREPVVAYISRYHNWKFMASEDIEHETLEEFVEDGQSPNHQTRDLARCLEDFHSMDFEMEADDIRVAAQRVLDERMVFCGITDLFEETVFLLCAIFGWRETSMWRRRLATPGRPRVEDLDPSLVAKIERLVEVDLEMYHQQREKLLDLFEATAFDSSFADYQQAARKTRAESFDAATLQKYTLLANKLRKSNAHQREQIAERDARIRDLERELLTASRRLREQDAILKRTADMMMRMRAQQAQTP